MDFDFDDIASGNFDENPKSEPYGITLTIPLNKSKGRWLSRDIAECSPEEFIGWLFTVYPLVDTDQLNVSYYDSLTARVKAYKDIEHFHRTQLFAKTKSAI